MIPILRLAKNTNLLVFTQRLMPTLTVQNEVEILSLLSIYAYMLSLSPLENLTKKRYDRDVS